MKCRHCLTDFHANTFETGLGFANPPKALTKSGLANIGYNAQTQVCSKCHGAHISIREVKARSEKIYIVFPRSGPAHPAPPEVPAAIAADYQEANEVMLISPKASAALSRRCLQAILAGAGYLSNNLATQVQNAVDQTDPTKALPADIRDSMDAIRNFGNFSAHPITDATTLQVIDVEPGEAEWCLELLTELFQHYYVRPQKAAERRAALNAKLAAAGKPEMKVGVEDGGFETEESGQA